MIRRGDIVVHTEHSGVTVLFPTIAIHWGRNEHSGRVEYYEASILFWKWALTVTVYRKLGDVLR